MCYEHTFVCHYKTTSFNASTEIISIQRLGLPFGLFELDKLSMVREYSYIKVVSVPRPQTNWLLNNTRHGLQRFLFTPLNDVTIVWASFARSTNTALVQTIWTPQKIMHVPTMDRVHISRPWTFTAHHYKVVSFATPPSTALPCFPYVLSDSISSTAQADGRVRRVNTYPTKEGCSFLLIENAACPSRHSRTFYTVKKASIVNIWKTPIWTRCKVPICFLLFLFVRSVGIVLFVRSTFILLVMFFSWNHNDNWWHQNIDIYSPFTLWLY